MTPSPARRAGILVPLFSIPSTRSWGIGEIADIEHLAAWLQAAGQRVLQLLPLNEMPLGERSPYSALSAMAIDPQFIAMRVVEDFDAIGGETALPASDRARLDAARLASRIDYDVVRPLKLESLRRAFAWFRDNESRTQTSRFRTFLAFCDEQGWWLDDYALFRALHARHDERPWTEWPDPVRNRNPAALESARAELADDVMFRKYVQWLAATQWSDVRRKARDVQIFGDLPFMVNEDSADVWARQDEFRLDVSVGVPPDAFSDTGQDWGLPAYRWDVLTERGFDWLRHRARRYADLYDGYRVDHLVGFYRTYFRDRSGGAGFTPPDEPSQRTLGEQVLSVFREPGAEIIAEDLGTVPDFVRESLTTLNVPGYKVLRWEREWHQAGQPFREPASYASTSVATSGTHDTEPMSVWWQSASPEERAAVLEMESMKARLDENQRACARTALELGPEVRHALLESLFASGANLLLLPIQDVFGWRDRVNQPATVGDDNWTWRLPWPSDGLLSESEGSAAAQQLREWSEKYGRD